MSVAVATASSTPTTPESAPLGPLNDRQESAASDSDTNKQDNKEMPPKGEHSHPAVIDFTHQETVEKILTMTSVDHNFKMKDGDLQALRKLEGNTKCIDCGEADPIWASVNLGVFVCLSCSGQHRAFGTHVSFVRSVQMDSWSDIQLKKMYKGGNDQCTEFLKKHGVSETSASVDKYDTPAAHLYQQVLSARIKGEPEPTELPEVPKKQPVKRESLKLEGFGSSPQPAGQQQKGLFQRFRTISTNDDGHSASSAPSSGNIAELPMKPPSFNAGEEGSIMSKFGLGSSRSMDDLCDVELSHRTSSERDTSGQFSFGENDNKEEEEEEVDDFNLDDLVNEIEEDLGLASSRWSDAAKESKNKEFKPPGEGEDASNEEGILRRISRSSWFGGGQPANKQKLDAVDVNEQQVDKLEAEIRKNEHDDIKSILEDDTDGTVATSQSPSAPELPPIVDEDGDIMPSPPGGFFRKVSRTISGKGVRRDTKEADEALDKFMDGL